MNTEDLSLAIQECNIGQLPFNLGDNRAFLFENKWYPLRALVNRASEMAGEDNDITTDRALVKLAYLGVWVRVKDVVFQDRFPVEMNNNEKLSELKKVTSELFKITSSI